MSAGEVNADFSERVRCDTGAMEWQPSPVAGVWRKRLELSGPAESGRVTSLVRFDPGAQFPTHGHPDGEEILVLDGTFSDEDGDYPKGTFLLNPDGSHHTPYSADGCLLFVKLRQFPGAGRAPVQVDTLSAPWKGTGVSGINQLALHHDKANGEKISLYRLTPGCEVSEHTHPGGEEIFILEGGLEDQYGRYAQGCWGRSPAGSHHWAKSETGCLFYGKLGHLS
ncbi:MAG: cupin domain-containing protein [Proteobacteria bacterium]|nr:cupin domain-containing protein [Pseudomonadota bacterium]MDA1355220.1 cupin domain-containing protein [Pseudomonadota bacterium]